MIKIICIGKLKEKYLSDFIDDYNNNIPHYMDIQIRRLVKKVVQAIQTTWINMIPNAADSLFEIRNKTHTVMMDMGLDYDLEYKELGSINALFANSSGSSRLEGNVADDYIDQAKTFVRNLNSLFRNNLKEPLTHIMLKALMKLSMLK